MKKRIMFVCCLALLALWLLWGNTALMVTEYTIESPRVPQSFSGCRIAQISDLHNASFGQGNRNLLRMLEKAKPDIIVITGDMIDSRNTDVFTALEFARGAVQIAPVYYVTGNHEARLSEYAVLKEGLEQLGAVVLENEKLRLEREGEFLTLMGVMDPSFLPGPDAEAVHRVLTELKAEDDGYTVLLCHRPELFDTYVSAGMDLVFSGHAHGGQVRIPFIGGVVAPNQGFFPQYDAGVFRSGSTSLIVSRGVGNSLCPLRVNNRPEIVVAELKTSF